MVSDLNVLWDVQQGQQERLGLDPKTMSDVNRRKAATDMIALLYEEAAEFSRLIGTHKQHILRQATIDPDNVADAVADILKTTIVLAQLQGLTVADVVEAFKRKTLVVDVKAQTERIQLRAHTRLICVDLDDVICDLSIWTKELDELRGNAPPNGRTLAMMESWKDDFYKSGRFKAMPAVENASESMRSLYNEGYTLVIVTARPQWQYKRLYADTVEWLKEHEVPFHQLLFSKAKADAVFDHLSPAWPLYFIEDMPRNALDLANVGIPVLLYDQEHNRGMNEVAGIRRVKNWYEILQTIGART